MENHLSGFPIQASRRVLLAHFGNSLYSEPRCLDMDNRFLPLNGLQVLIVDSDPDSRELLTMLLEVDGATTITTTSVGQALEVLEHVHPDLLISEIALPGEDGYSLMSKVKLLELKHRMKIPAIALTASDSVSDRARALAAGFCQYLAKPCDIEKLLAVVTSSTKQNQLLPTL